MKLTIIKHGKTDLNVEGKRQGRTDLSLNEIGRTQVHELKEKIGDSFDAIIVSPMKRTLETAQILFPDTKLITNDLLVEFDFGELEGELFSKTPEDFPDNKTMFCNDIEFILPNEGETFEDITQRCKDLLEYLRDTFDDTHSIAIVTHSTNMEILKALIEDKSWNTYLAQSKMFQGVVECDL